MGGSSVYGESVKSDATEKGAFILVVLAMRCLAQKERANLTLALIFLLRPPLHQPMVGV